ncbi:conserved hypothetical protein [Histoplasma capsulatum var. duboisii H88]|uniref:Uncharacterized protein n=1 Tax=Ajellomyces capsulatus (strain H88) TaxID=544711 RepID=F0U935_AJEC8|nr:conserved hypothetical protein [Histoplasma capsulatum var. duboisii H88]
MQIFSTNHIRKQNIVQESENDQLKFQSQSSLFAETANEDFTDSDSDNNASGEEALLFPAEPYNKDAADNVEYIKWLLKAAVKENILENDDQEDSDGSVAEDIAIPAADNITIAITSYSTDQFVDSDSAIDIAHKHMSSMQISTLSSAQKNLAESFMRSLYFQNPILLISALLKSPTFW